MNGTLEKEIALNNFQLVVAHGTDAPIERSGHRIFADQDYIYMVGGYNANPERTLTDAWRFNRLTQEWQQCTLANPASPLPDTLASFSLVSRGPGPDFNCGSNEAYFYGGTKVPFGGESNTDRFYWIKIDKTGRVHLQLQSINGEEPLPRMYGQGMCRRIEQNAAGRLREVIYIVGGTTGHEYNMDVWKMQRPANAQQNEAWHLMRLNRRIPDEFGRYRLELVPHGQLLFSFGGSISDQYFIRLDELTAFNLALNEFEQIKTKPDPNHGYPRERSCHSLVHQGNMVYLCGGRDMEMTIFDTIWRFNLETLQWTQLNTGLSIPVFFNSAAITPDGCIFVFGGVTIDPTNRGLPKRVNQLQRMWLQPPSLHFIASEVVLKNISSERIHQLTAEGVRLSDVLMLVHRILQNEPNSNSSAENHQPIPVPIDESSSPPNPPFHLNQLLPLFYSPYFLFFQVLILAVLWSFVSSLLTRFDLKFL